MQKTNAIRILEKENISHSIHTYPVDESDLSGITVANKIGAEPERVFKTLVTRGDNSAINIFCIPVTEELNLKKAAVVSGNKKVEMIKEKELFPLTGYLKGGCSPIGMKKKYSTYIDETAELFGKIYVSAGARGMQVKLKLIDLKKITEAHVCNLL